MECCGGDGGGVGIRKRQLINCEIKVNFLQPFSGLHRLCQQILCQTVENRLVSCWLRSNRLLASMGTGNKYFRARGATKRYWSGVPVSPSADYWFYELLQILPFWSDRISLLTRESRQVMRKVISFDESLQVLQIQVDTVSSVNKRKSYALK